MSAPETNKAEVHAPVYVYELPVRLWHWVTAPCIIILAATGYLIGNPAWPLIAGEPFHHYVMGDIRFIHFTAAYILGIGFLLRVYWVLMGNRYAKEIFILAVWRKSWWHELFQTLRWYSFQKSEPMREVGHNPVAQLAILAVFVLGVLFQLVTGFALYGEGAGGWAHTLFTSWVIPLFGGSMEVHTWHHLAMWYILIFVIAHIYLVIREDIMSRQTMISTMISGWRYFKDSRS
ncbi:Ni/Fe-hydrogenase, b-type cytochrome subunit [Acidocella aromatica]|uniref:Ni/Fe-hydrogenase 1 B-type cytochrome subunit n=1 Tax=Acidocella aromatica TaxID=1303579 RepID=A0A840VQ71_9PROT|nr:Ni/Fe-hydrogenase, b-type cytochrome subunit [Acidocella aromatica]MBB5373550.1 Ni/Fe-hydrogenase 1 B-type cytochrome subunit [Acidocella aromatica]